MSNTKVLKLDIDLKDVTLPAENKNISPAEVTVNTILNTLIELSKKSVGFRGQSRGMNKKERKQFWTINDLLDSAVKEKKTEVELPDDLIGFIRTAFNETNLTPNALLRKVEENLDSVANR